MSERRNRKEGIKIANTMYQWILINAHTYNHSYYAWFNSKLILTDLSQQNLFNCMGLGEFVERCFLDNSGIDSDLWDWFWHAQKQNELVMGSAGLNIFKYEYFKVILFCIHCKDWFTGFEIYAFFGHSKLFYIIYLF